MILTKQDLSQGLQAGGNYYTMLEDVLGSVTQDFAATRVRGQIKIRWGPVLLLAAPQAIIVLAELYEYLSADPSPNNLCV